jgi:hypothetical protein
MDDGRRNLEEEDVMGEIIREGAEGPSVGDDIQEGPGPSTGDDIELEGDVTLSFLNNTNGEGESGEAGSEDEEVDRDDDYDERTEEGAVAKSGEVYILVYIACADETS